MSDDNREEFRLNHVLGKSRGVDTVGWARLESWIQANLRLGRSMIVTIDKHGDAVCDSWSGERDV